MNNRMKLKRVLQSILVLVLTGGAVSAWATIETTSPVWVATATTIQGNGGSGSKLTVFSQRMVLPIQYAGTISSVQNATMTDTNATWNNGQFGTNGTLSYVEFDDGWMMDIAT